MKIHAPSTEQINQMILDGSDASQVANAVELWEMKNGTAFIYPKHKPQVPTYIHHGFGEVPEQR